MKLSCAWVYMRSGDWEEDMTFLVGKGGDFVYTFCRAFICQWALHPLNEDMTATLMSPNLMQIYILIHIFKCL